jgi:hypothetical protein
MVQLRLATLATASEESMIPMPCILLLGKVQTR